MIILKKFIDNATIIELTPKVKQKTADIRKAGKIKLPDAIIAATALVHNLTLITRNTKDFKNVDRLKIVNPFEV